MTTKVTMPQMGESIFEGTLTKWLKKAGDNVVRDEPLFEISTDKVDSEIPSPASGVLSQILVPEGKTVQVNTVLAIINEKGTEAREAPITHSREVALKEIPEEAPAKPEPRPVNPEPKKIEVFPPPALEQAKPVEVAPGIPAQDIRTSPLVRRIARENNIDLSEIHGTGLERRITKEDVLNYLAQRSAPRNPNLHAFAPNLSSNRTWQRSLSNHVSRLALTPLQNLLQQWPLTRYRSLLVKVKRFP